jgi:hypothetical protein
MDILYFRNIKSFKKNNVILIKKHFVLMRIINTFELNYRNHE